VSPTILVVDDHETSAMALAEGLASAGYTATAVSSAAAALQWLAEHPATVVITDLRMDGMDGIGLRTELRATRPSLPVILVTAYATVDRAVEATRSGAFAFLTKPVRLTELRVQVRNAVDQARLAEAADRPAPGDDEIVGRSAVLLRALAMADRAAASDATVRITGESGTGKELFARRIHRRSPRRTGAFVPVNCGAIPESLLEGELFGHAKGSFTGANADRAGLIESASGGTLFLDEVGELSPGAQTRLLRFLQEGTIRRVGDTRDGRVDVRVVAATHRELQSESFRLDLYYRLDVIPIVLPPLRARRDDVPLLLGVALQAACGRLRRPLPSISGPALERLLSHDWPGNVRELFNLAERLSVLVVGNSIELADLPPKLGINAQEPDQVRLPSGDFDLTGFLEGIEERALRRALQRHDGVKAQAAASLGLERNAFRYKLKKYGIDG